MKQIFLDTETTGLKVAEDHRIIEVVAMIYESRTSVEASIFHEYCNPERDISEGALSVHGMDQDFLADKPLFADIAENLQDFLRGGEIIIHNAAFDCDFLDYEFSRLSLPPVEKIADSIVCSLTLSRRVNLALRRHRLEDLCRHYNIDDSARTTHNALIDTRLLAQVYRAMTRGQIPMDIKMGSPEQQQQMDAAAPVLVRLATTEECAEHENYLRDMEADTGVKPMGWR